MIKRIPNMRVLVTLESKNAVLAAGACVGYSNKHGSHIYAEGKPSQLYRLLGMSGVERVGEIEEIPRRPLTPDEIQAISLARQEDNKNHLKTYPE